MDLGGLTLTPGVYSFSSSAFLTGVLTLDAQGDAAAEFVFQIGSTLITASGSSVRTINGASGCNVYWQVGSSATLGTTTAFRGNILALTSIDINTGAAIVDGRALARNGEVTMQSNTVAGDCIPGAGNPPCNIDCPPDIGPVSADEGECCAITEFDVTLPDDPACVGTTLECTIIDSMGAAIPITSPYCFPEGVTTVTCTVRNAAGAAVDVCAFTVTVTDTQAPGIVCSPDVTQSNDPDLCGAEVSFIIGVSDNCDVLPALACTIPDGTGGFISVSSGYFFPVGTTTVTCIATDAAGNASEPCQFTITVNDTQGPTITCLQEVEIPVTGCDPIVLTAEDILAGGLAGITDNCCTEGFIVSIEPSSFQCPTLGSLRAIAVRVTDCNGNTSTCTASIYFTAPDCNANSLADYCDICDGTSLDCNENWVPDECECFWCNVPAETFGAKPVPEPDVNAQLSHLGGGTQCGEKVADDFYLEPGCTHRITAVRGRMLTTSHPQLLRARLELYEDCDGKPVDEPFFTADYNTPTGDAIPSQVLSFSLAPDGESTIVNYRFDLCDACIWLDGGKTYWVSLIGLTDNIDQQDLSYWVAGDENLPILGSIPVKRSGTPGSTWGSCNFTGPWESLEDCCIGCVNMDFCVDGYSCPIIWDNGDVDLVNRGGSPSGGHQQYHDRTADSFVVKTCRDEELCLIEAWIWTNCVPVHGFIELYEDLGCDPRLDDVPFRIYDGEEIEATRLEETWTIGGRTYQLWKLLVKDPDITLQGAHNYWVSAGARSTGNFSSNSFFAWSKYGCDPCNGVNTFRITPGQHKRLRPPATDWADVIPPRDFAFRISAKAEDAIPTDTEGPFGTPDCIADANGNGEVAVDDIFAFLSAWFVGCP